jgi:DMSO reductase family type II enzyme chaperone
VLLERLSALDGEGVARLEAEYLDLFVLGGARPPCPLHESAHLDRGGRRRGLIAAGVERAYAEAGLAVSPSLDGELPDHVACELEFLAHLCAEEGRAWRSRRADRAALLLDRERRFLDRHLLRWFPSLARRVAASAEGSFYVEVVEAAHAFLVHDRDLIGLLLEAQRGLPEEER